MAEAGSEVALVGLTAGQVAARLTNAAIGVVQELRANRTLDRLVVLSAPRAEVRRDGATVATPAEEIVRGDVVGLRTGDQVVADGELLVANGDENDEP